MLTDQPNRVLFGGEQGRVIGNLLSGTWNAPYSYRRNLSSTPLRVLSNHDGDNVIFTKVKEQYNKLPYMRHDHKRFNWGIAQKPMQ